MVAWSFWRSFPVHFISTSPTHPSLVITHPIYHIVGPVIEKVNIGPMLRKRLRVSWWLWICKHAWDWRSRICVGWRLCTSQSIARISKPFAWCSCPTCDWWALCKEFQRLQAVHRKRIWLEGYHWRTSFDGKQQDHGQDCRKGHLRLFYWCTRMKESTYFSYMNKQ